MRLGLALALVLAISAGASAQHHQPKVKPSHKDEKQAKSGSTAKLPATHGSAAQELHRVEQQSAKTSASQKGANRKAHLAPVLKPEREKKAPQIRFSGSGSGNRGGMNKQGSNPYKGRLRQKGSHR